MTAKETNDSVRSLTSFLKSTLDRLVTYLGFLKATDHAALTSEELVDIRMVGWTVLRDFFKGGVDLNAQSDLVGVAANGFPGVQHVPLFQVVGALAEQGEAVDSCVGDFFVVFLDRQGKLAGLVEVEDVKDQWS